MCELGRIGRFEGIPIYIGEPTYFKDENEMKRYKRLFDRDGIKGTYGLDERGYNVRITFIPENLYI